MTELPDPLVPPDCDCRDLDGFMLNVERLMASELVALSTHEEIAAAFLLWCRAWKQMPAASLPDDDRVLAAFAKLPLPRFKKIKSAALRGFVKCSDGRLYHRFLAREAAAAYERKMAFRNKRGNDAERLRKWRASHRETRGETDIETQGETRFVAEGQGQGQGERKKDAAASRASGPGELFANGHAEPPERPKPNLSDPKTQLYDRAKAILGANSGGLVTKLLDAKGGSVAQARAALETASERADAREYLGAIIRGKPPPGGDAYRASMV